MNPYVFETGAEDGHPWGSPITKGFWRNIFTVAGDGVATGLWFDKGYPYLIIFEGTATLSGYPKK
jgi:hypothetical protein